MHQKSQGFHFGRTGVNPSHRLSPSKPHLDSVLTQILRHTLILTLTPIQTLILTLTLTLTLILKLCAVRPVAVTPVFLETWNGVRTPC